MIHAYLILALLLFGIGIVGVISRRNIIIIYMSVELLLNGVNLALIAVSSHLQTGDGQIISMMVIAIAAAEAALFMALFVVLFRTRRSLDANLFNLLGERRD
jgi:NADH-quinone oxidoreductase subunit K